MTEAYPLNWRAFGADVMRARDEKRMTMKDLIELLDGAYTAWEHSEDSRTVGEHMRAALAEAGLAIVPVEPTEAMLSEGTSSLPVIDGQPLVEDPFCLIAEGVWKAMLRASQETDDE